MAFDIASDIDLKEIILTLLYVLIEIEYGSLIFEKIFACDIAEDKLDAVLFNLLL